MVDGMKLYDGIFDNSGVRKMVSLINDLRAAGRRGQFQGKLPIFFKWMKLKYIFLLCLQLYGKYHLLPCIKRLSRYQHAFERVDICSYVFYKQETHLLSQKDQ